MNISIFWFLLLLLASLMTTLTWVGLKFFCPSEGPRRTTPGSPRRMPRFRLRLDLRFPTFLRAMMGRQVLWLVMILPLVGLMVTLTLALSEHIRPPAMTGEDLGPTDDVGVVLREEILVPPQPLPPSVFIGTECFDLEHADRDWSKLDAGFRNSVLQLFARMETRGYRMALLEGSRSAERQEMLFQQGPGVTRARGGRSKHQYGLAADIAPLREGRLMISERDPWAAAAYRTLGEEAENLGLAWGGRWAMRDLGHVESAARIGAPARMPMS